MPEPYQNTWVQIRTTILVALALAGGIFLGATTFSTSGTKDDINANFSRFREVLTYVSREYVDTVNTDELTNYAIEQMLEKLDPHSVFIPKKEVVQAKAALEGDFEGIGVEFLIVKDTIQVVAPISGGPSESVGIKSGDRIIKVDGVNMAGVKVTNSDVFSKLRGPKGTKVTVTVARAGVKEALPFVITRDKIPHKSVDIALMLDKEMGYIKVSRFAASTYDEFAAGLKDLKAKGMKRLVLDLRDNPGGYMDRATKMADELLGSNELIVYTKNKDGRYNQQINAERKGTFESGAVIVLINEGSASASEIVSGAVQDNDRGLVVGRRSFGKGLVQMPIPMSDGSELRLTISRYYTPSGRSIQKPYDAKTGLKDYENDFTRRFEHGEFFHADSIKFDEKLKYKTAGGRTVYGGGGVMPDLFVPLDTSKNSKYLADLYNKNILREYGLNYANANKATLQKQGLDNFLKKWQVDASMMSELKTLTIAAKGNYSEKDEKLSEPQIKNTLKAFIGRNVFREPGFYPVLLEQDELFQTAIKQWTKAEAIAAMPKNMITMPR